MDDRNPDLPQTTGMQSGRSTTELYALMSVVHFKTELLVEIQFFSI